MPPREGLMKMNIEIEVLHLDWLVEFLMESPKNLSSRDSSQEVDLAKMIKLSIKALMEQHPKVEILARWLAWEHLTLISPTWTCKMWAWIWWKTKEKWTVAYTSQRPPELLQLKMVSMLSLVLQEASQDKSIEPLERISLIKFLTRQEPLLFRMQLEPTNLVHKLLKTETQLLGQSMSQENHPQVVTQTIKKSPKPRTMFHKQ